MNYDLCGKNLYHAVYKAKNCSHEAQRYIICENVKIAKREIESYDVENFTIKAVQEDISIVVI